MKDILFKVLMLKGDAGEPTDEQTQSAVDEYMQAHPEAAIDEAIINSAVDDWLDEHPEATTTVQDGSLTEPKFSDALTLKTIKDYVTPQMFGAVGDGITDDSQAILSALSASEHVIFPKGAYFSSTAITIPNGSTIEFLHGAEILFNGTNGFVTNNEARKIKLIKPVVRQISGERTGIGILLLQAQNCEIISPYVNMFDEGICLDGQNTWCASNYIENPYIYQFNIGIHLTAGVNKQVNDTKIVGGYVVDQSRSGTYGFKLDCQGDSNKCFGLAVEDLDIGFYNGSSAGAGSNLILIGCRAENCASYSFRNAGEGAFTFGCYFQGTSLTLYPYKNNVEAKNIDEAFFKSKLQYYDSGNNLRTWLVANSDGIKIGPGGSNKKLQLSGTDSSQVSTTYIELGGANGLMFPVRGFIMKSATSGSSKYFKITVNDSGQLSATEVTPT